MVKIPHNWVSHPDFDIIDPNLGLVSLQITPTALNMILGTSQSTQEIKKMGLLVILNTN